MHARALLSTSLGGLLAALALGVAAAVMGGAWASAHVAVGLYGFLLPGLAFYVWQVAGPLLPRPLGSDVPVAAAWAAGATILAAAALLPDPFDGWGRLLGMVCVLAASGMQMGRVLKATPRRGESVVDVARDALTKGDDASLKHIRFGHFFLPISLLVLTLMAIPGVEWAAREGLTLAALHWLLAGHALLLAYGLSHIVVPRLSKVPAIAAGAIKGELHSSLLGLVLLAFGFLWPSTAMIVVGGALLFFGAFVFMGVLGANIMKNKSPTQRVTPEFAYVPWTFAGVFWLVAGVLLGLFLAAARVRFADYVAPLTFVHVHATLLGGFGLLLLGFATRLLPESWGRAGTFQQGKWPFYGLNLGLTLLVYGRLVGGADLELGGGILAAVAAAGWFMTLRLPSKAP